MPQQDSEEATHPQSNQQEELTQIPTPPTVPTDAQAEEQTITPEPATSQPIIPSQVTQTPPPIAPTPATYQQNETPTFTVYPNAQPDASFAIAQTSKKIGSSGLIIAIIAAAIGIFSFLYLPYIAIKILGTTTSMSAVLMASSDTSPIDSFTKPADNPLLSSLTSGKGPTMDSIIAKPDPFSFSPLWLILIAFALILAISICFLVKNRGKQPSKAYSLLASIVTLIISGGLLTITLIMYGNDTTTIKGSYMNILPYAITPADFLGIGFWIIVFAAGIACFASIVQVIQSILYKPTIA